MKANQACNKIRGQESDTLLRSLSICPCLHSRIQGWCSIIIRFPFLCERPFLKHQELHEQGSLQYWMSIHLTLPCPHLLHPHFTRQACKCQHTWHGLGGWQTRSVTLPLQPQRNITRIHGNNVQNLNSQNVSWTLRQLFRSTIRMFPESREFSLSLFVPLSPWPILPPTALQHKYWQEEELYTWADYEDTRNILGVQVSGWLDTGGRAHLHIVTDVTGTH